MQSFLPKKVTDYETAKDSEMATRVQSRLQSWVAEGKVNLTALCSLSEDYNLGPYNYRADPDHVVAM